MASTRPFPAATGWRKEKKAGDKDKYRVIVARADISKAFRLINKINDKLRERKSKPLFERITPYHDVLVVHSSRSNFRKILEANMSQMSPCILRSPSLPGRRHRSRFVADHPILGPC